MRPTNCGYCSRLRNYALTPVQLGSQAECQNMTGIIMDNDVDHIRPLNQSPSGGIPVEEYFNLSFKALSIMGLRVNFENKNIVEVVKITKTMRLYLGFVMGIILVGPEVLFIVNSVEAGDSFMAIQALTHLFSNLVCLIKGIRIAALTSKVENVYERIKMNWLRNNPGDEIREEVLRSAGKTVKACNTVKGIAIFTVISFALLPLPEICGQLVNRESINSSFEFSQRILLYRSPIEVNKPLNYLLIYIYDMYLISMYATYWFTCDSLFAQMTSHVSMQFKVLKHDVGALMNGRVSKEQLKNNFKNIVERHRELLSICELIENIFSPVLLGVVLFSSMAICVNVFELSEMIAQGKYIEAATNASLNMVTLFQIIFYCFFAENLADATSEIGNALYNCNWIEKDPKYGCYFQMIIIQSQRPFQCTGMGFFIMDYPRLRLVLNTAVSYYMLLRTLN
ncbi:hypothetical protein QAD02_018524 [Eretmocerus hayati]|uniref:Uncharacterized protein n=1 Tax=Eretmocerus hayati TaxID=131215 RepID=A0ACC2PHA9_9HYME|nr:hypothetical protein QAD02_018524 [Eretmocerus hayati]